MMLWTTLFSCVILHIPTIQFGGTVEIYLNSFVNSGGLGNNGICCDSALYFSRDMHFLCDPGCDHLFIVCLDDRNGPSSTSTCQYGSIRTGNINDNNTITFGSNIGGIENPMFFQFSKWPGSMKLKVRVEDNDDKKQNDFVSFHQTLIEQTPANSRSTAEEKTVSINNRTRYNNVHLKLKERDIKFGSATRFEELGRAVLSASKNTVGKDKSLSVPAV
ncbi:delta-like protein 4 [Ruditapes philippinarum]|uniref:delta-like protein 4 n=1 Tax=Ruditapes philippinarum TaxID=129788 RepID=UPI00295BD287|nr:delta-like protein 4 [Ruditapes philippinarum]